MRASDGASWARSKSRANQLIERDLAALEFLSQFPGLGAAVHFLKFCQVLLYLGRVLDGVGFVAILFQLLFAKHEISFRMGSRAACCWRERVQAVGIDDGTGGH